MKELYTINEQAGEAQIDGAVGVDSENILLKFQIKHPHKQVTDKIFAFADSIIDKLEEVLPGDQKSLATKAKSEVREFAMNLLGIPEANVPQVETAQVEAEQMHVQSEPPKASV